MQALRDHPFFSTINWRTIWTDPAPPLEAGLLKKETPPPTALIHSAWDALVNSDHYEDTVEDDEVSWGSDGEGGDYPLGAGQTNGQQPGPAVTGLLGNTRRSALPPLPLANVTEERSGSHDGVRFMAPPPKSETPVSEDERRDTVNDELEFPGLARSPPIDVPRVPGPGSHSTGSVTSSSDGSPVDKLAAMDEAARGRNRAQTPIQGNALCDPEL